MINISNVFNPGEGPDNIIKQLPLVPLRDMVLFPFVPGSVFVGRDNSIKALSEAMSSNRKIFLTTQKNPEEHKPTINDIFQVGTESIITQILRLPDGTVKALVEGRQRGKIMKLMDKGGYLGVEYKPVTEIPMSESAKDATIRTLVETFEKYAVLSGNVSKIFLKNIVALAAHESRFADTLAAQMPFKLAEKQQLLECTDVEERFMLLLQFIRKETEVLAMSQKIKGRVKDQMDKLQKKHYLNEQIRAIKKEMGEDSESGEFKELEKKIRKKRMSREATLAVKREMGKLKMMAPMSSEATVVRNYIDWLISLPW